MSSKKSRVKLKDKIDTPQKNEEPFNLSYVKKSLLTSCRRVGLTKKKSNSKPNDIFDPDLQQEIVGSPRNDPTEMQDNEASTSKISPILPVIIDEKPKSSTSRRKKSSHPLKRTISEPNNSESEIVTLQIVSPVNKRRKLDFIDIFNPDKGILNDNKSGINVNKKVINKNEADPKVNSLKNKNGNSLPVSLPLNVSKNVLNSSKKIIKENQNDLSSAMIKNNSVPNVDVSKSSPSELVAPPPLKKRKIVDKFIATVQNKKEVPVSTKKINSDIKLSDKKTEIDLKVAEKPQKPNKSRKVKKEVKSKTPKIKLATKNPKSNHVEKEENEINLPKSRTKTSKKVKINNKAEKKSRKKTNKFNAELLSDYKAIVDNNFTVSVNKSKHVKNDITITIDKPPLLSNNCNLNNESSCYNTETIVETQVIIKGENNLLNIENPSIEKDTTELPRIDEENKNSEKTIEPDAILSKSETPEIVPVPDEPTAVEPCDNSQDTNIVPHIRNKAEKKIYSDLPTPEVIFTPPRNPDTIRSPKSSPSPTPKTKIDKSKMDYDQLSEESYESSHYSPPAYSPIEVREAEEHIGDIECQNTNIILEKNQEIVVSTINVTNEESISSFVEPIELVNEPNLEQPSDLSETPETKIPEIKAVEESPEEKQEEDKEVISTSTIGPLEIKKPSRRKAKTRRNQTQPKNNIAIEQTAIENVFTAVLENVPEKEESKSELLNYYPRVLINRDEIDNYFKELEAQRILELGSQKPNKTPRKRRRNNTPFGFRRKRKRRISEKRISDRQNEVPQFKDDESIGIIESVFFTPPSSRSENDSDSNRNDFRMENELTVNENPFGEGTSMNCITPITSKITGSTTSRDLITVEDEEVASLSVTSATTTTNERGESRPISRLSESSSNFELDSNVSRPLSRVPTEYSSDSCGLKTYPLSENSSVTVMRMGQCIEYIKWNNSAKRKNLRTVYSKSSILNRCAYSKTVKPITSMFDSILNEPEPSTSKQIDEKLTSVDVNLLPKPIELLKQVKEVESRIKSKKITLNKLKECDKLVKNTTELRKRAQGALLEFAAFLRQQSGTPFNMESLLYNMSIPHHVVGYNADDDDFI